MPVVDFNALPGHSRVWIFASDRPLRGEDADVLLEAVDRFLEQWKAHGAPLRSAREWRDDHFLVIGVDPTAEQASGCSIDGLFRALKALEKEIGSSIVTSGLIFFRDRAGQVRSVTREEFSNLGANGEVDGDTEVFDLSVTSLGEWRARFASHAAHSWHSSLIPARTA